MKSLKVLSALLLSCALVFSSCGTWNNTQKGAAIGVGGGAAVGAGVGALAGNTALGTVIGATLPEETTVETINDGEALKVTFDSGILFATNSSTLSDASKSALRNLATSLNQNPGTDIKIVGHTDNTGNVDYNQTLSEKRAKSVFDYLMVDQGVSSKRMTYEGKGIHEPVADNSTVEGRALNRRVEILILPSQQMIQEAQNGTLK